MLDAQHTIATLSFSMSARRFVSFRFCVLNSFSTNVSDLMLCQLLPPAGSAFHTRTTDRPNEYMYIYEIDWVFFSLAAVRFAYPMHKHMIAAHEKESTTFSAKAVNERVDVDHLYGIVFSL